MPVTLLDRSLLAPGSQVIKLLFPERVKPGAIRLTFIAGERVLSYVSSCVVRQKAMNTLLGSANWEDICTRLLAGQRASAKEKKALADELASYLGQSLAVTHADAALIVIHRADADAPFVKAVLDELLPRVPAAAVLFTAGADRGEGTFVVASANADLAARLGPLAAERLHGRGGGKAGRYQGKAANMEERAAAEAALRAALASA